LRLFIFKNKLFTLKNVATINKKQKQPAKAGCLKGFSSKCRIAVKYYLFLFFAAFSSSITRLISSLFAVLWE
jgi:hypothetical protein